MHRAIGLQGLVVQGLHRLEARDVRDDTRDVKSLVAEFGDGALEGLLLYVGQDDLHAFLREPFDRARDRATGCTGDDGDTVGQLLHQSLPTGDRSSYR